MNDVVSPLCGTSHPCGDLEVGRAVPAADIPSWFPGGLAFEMGRKDGWDQYSGHLGRGHLGTVDLGADGSLEDVEPGGHSQRCCKEIRRGGMLG